MSETLVTLVTLVLVKCVVAKAGCPVADAVSDVKPAPIGDLLVLEVFFERMEAMRELRDSLY